MDTLNLFDRLSNSEAAEILGLQPQTLDVWRCTGRYDLPYYKIGRRVYYKRADIECFIERQRRLHT